MAKGGKKDMKIIVTTAALKDAMKSIEPAIGRSGLLKLEGVGRRIILTATSEKGFSIEANYMHAWWKSDPHNWYWRTYGGDLGIRYWFGRAAKEKPLSGHHIGAYGQVITYDFELGNLGIIGGQPGGQLIDEPNYTVGLEYGYSVPIARRLNIDFAIGFGYHWGVFYEYVPKDDCYVWQTKKSRSYIGPTKVGISLVYLIGRGNTNNHKKGGER